MLRKLAVVLSTGAFALGACSSDTTPANTLCTGVTAPCVAFPTGTSATDITTALNGTVAANTTFVFGSGTFTFTNTVNLPLVAGLKIVGQGIDTTTFDFSGQAAGAGGIKAADGTQNITFTKFTVKDTKGDGIDVKGANGVYFQTVKVLWTDPVLANHGAYALYPVSSTNVLIESCVVSGSRDAGIYVGQSSNIIVRNNEVHDSVAGIEIEASSDADVYGNNTHDNTGGILVFALPGLRDPSGAPGTSNVRVYNNNIHDNNTLNFGATGTTVSEIPAGTGLLIIASANVEVFGNTFTDNNAVALVVATYCTLDLTSTPNFCDSLPNPIDLQFNPFSGPVYVHNNTFTGNGTSPSLTNAAGQVNLFGGLLYTLLFVQDAFPGGAIPDLLWDGIAPPPYTPPSGAGTSGGTPDPNPVPFWQLNNGASVTFANLNFQGGLIQLPSQTPHPEALRFDIDDFTWPGTPTANPPGFPLPAITIPGVT
jgi:parallel beta-helix repeat protein